MIIAHYPPEYLIEPAALRIPLSSLAVLRAPLFVPATLFETHLALWLTAVAIGAIALAWGHMRNHLRTQQAGAAILALSILWIAAAIIFDTPAERLHKAHVAMAADAERGDIDGLIQYLAPEFTIEGVAFPSEAGTPDRQQLAAQLRESHIREVSIRHYESTLTSASDAQTTVTVLVASDAIPPLTTWRVTWKDIPNADWRITAARLIRVGDEAVPAGGISTFR